MSAIGELAPDLRWIDQRGQCKRLSDLRGHSVLVLFSANAWDPALRYQLQDQREMLMSLAVAGRIPVHGNTPGAMENDDWCEIEDQDIERFPFLADFDSEGDIAERFGVRGVGAIFLIDPDGRVRWRYVAPDAGQVNLSEALNSLRADCRHRISRREFLVASLAVSLALSLSPPPAPAQTTTTSARAAANDGRDSIVLHVNGTDRSLQVEPRVTLLDALRERLKLTGTKKGCDHGQCGACTVLVNDRRINACLMLAVQAQGARITTIEGLAQRGDLHPMQAAFIRHDGFQCGYCTPGQIMSAIACIQEGHAGGEAEIEEWMSGNICRCGAYNGIRQAIIEINAERPA